MPSPTSTASGVADGVMRRMVTAALGLAAAGAVAAQTPPADFLATARAAATRYADPAAAAASGYHAVGPDIPAMGRHWVHGGLLLAGVLDAARPTILEYAEIDGRPALVGVAYAVLVPAGEPPAGLPVPPEAWHFHGGTVDAETFVSSHAGAGREGPGPRIAVLHVWLGATNPDGLFASDNWALPYARLGIPVPAVPAATVSRALGLTACAEYFDALLRVVGRPPVGERDTLAAIVRSAEQEVHAALAARRTPPALDADDARRLGVVWTGMWGALRRAASPPVWARLAPFAQP